MMDVSPLMNDVMQLLYRKNDNDIYVDDKVVIPESVDAQLVT